MPPPKRPADFQEATGPEPGWFDLVMAGWQDQAVKGTAEESLSLGVATRDAWQSLRNELDDAAWSEVMAIYNSYGPGRKPIHQPDMPDGAGVMLQTLQEYRARLPEAERARIPTTEQLQAKGRERSFDRYLESQRTISRAPDNLSSASAIFSGGAVGAMTDPANIAAMALIRYPATSIVKTAAIEGAVGMGAQAIIEPITYDYMNDIGVDYSVEDSINSILQAGAGGAAVGGLFRAGEKLVVRATGGIPIDELRVLERRALAGDAKAIQTYSDYVARRIQDSFRPAAETPETIAAARSVVDDLDAFDAENPFAGSDGPGRAEAEARHMAASVRAEEVLRGGRATGPAPQGEPPATVARPPQDGVQMMDLASLRRDPFTFQYKDSDADGVTPALQGVDTWAPERAGLIIAWERADGTRYVVDGHQRHALAGRLVSEGHAPISAPVYLLREADGIDAAAARAKAAIKNIGEGSGTALDAAYILRSSRPEDLRGLPPNSALVRNAAGLARLSDDAFGMVDNRLVDERWGAIVGRLVDDQALQAQVLQAVHRLDPQTPAAAESMVRDMLAAPRVESQTMDLFGSATTSELLIAERAKIKASAMALLGKNRTAFRVALQRQAELERQGNVLAARRNREALDADTAAALRLEKDAHLKGWVSDTLSQAAKDLRDGSSLTEVTGRLVEALRRGAGGGDPGRAGAGGAGRAAEGAGAARQADGAEAGADGGDGARERVSKKSLQDGGPEAWRRELTREDATTDDIERVLRWLEAEPRRVIEPVRDGFFDYPASASRKADLVTEVRGAVRDYHAKRLANDDLPPSLFDDDPDVTRMRAAEDALREPIDDTGARLAAEAELVNAGDAARLASEEADLASIEADLKELRRIEESDPTSPLHTFVDPETGEKRPMSALLDELQQDRQRLQVLEACAYPGGKATAGKVAAS